MAPRKTHCRAIIDDGVEFFLGDRANEAAQGIWGFRV